MKRIFPVLLFLFYSASLSAQQSGLPLASTPLTSEHPNTLLVTADFSFASNAITNQLAKTYFLNGFITDAMKDEVSKKLDDKNRLGGEFSTELYFTHKPDSLFGRKDLSWFIGMKNINHVSSTFSRDLFEVYFRGNKNYAGKTADFSDFNYLSLKYQQLLFGLSKFTKKKYGTFEAGASIGFNVGQQLLRIKSDNASLFTEDAGEYLDVNTDVEIYRSDSLHKNFASFNGFGLSTDLFFKANIKKKHFFFARISNLGFIRWNENSTSLKEDTIFRFNGVDVSSLFDFGDTIRTTITIDSAIVQPFLTHRKYQTYTLTLPAKIEVSYMKAIGQHNLRAGIGMAYILNGDYFPLIHLDGDYTWKNNLLALTVSYGGYTTFGSGIFYSHHFHHGYTVAIGSNYINSLFNIDTATSEHASITVYRNF